MMAQPSHDAHVIGPQFVVPYQINVVVNRCPTGYLEITDIQNNIMFTIRSCNTPLHCQRLMRDGRGTPIAMLRAKNRTAHDRWNIFRGQSNVDSDMIFTAAKNNMIQNQTYVNVFLGNKTSHNVSCDFHIEGSWSKRNCAFFSGNTSTIIAQMRLAQPPERFMVTISPNVDYAFVVALIGTIDAMKSSGSIKAAAHVAVGIATGAVRYISGVGPP
ncbi:putative tubby-like protein [Helianthus annuus]|uniref:Putative tubby C-terminal-like domain-containing protein n=1 Tax=Helianthus annuus TaxID=4232 RepID=A0A251SVY4_HELAN|nr:protein LURP-one-related 15 isoform X1 [Helianthus annuus]KAF5775038.1 putative tubby-like protein [Helianthus annuus]KAJ0478244.1 putative tubby-like protein [Helianthus annuus]KAJ0499128.1 putative tubby-like protein [Helianthus annuus]KAJ0665142.1 putative tubby-like protein [Helianthus annuus]KAJ0672560.1 putative tubby-like protein [Helianthus annuus]